MKIEETVPVLRHRGRKTYLPSAPCRFTADGGYVQGCNMELAQRLMQADWSKAAARDPAALGEIGVLFGALVLFLATSFVLARWFCGWVCPLSAIGGALDWLRRMLRLPHLKPARPVKLAYLFSGAGLAGLTLAMARAYPSLDQDGRFLGCKIPLYPFCKICPSQQVCPVASGGPGAYAGLPTWAEWPFFRTAVLALLVIFAASFALGRRLWCRFCPMGMISGLFNRGGLVRLRKDAAKCNRCGVCADVCPMDIDLVRSEMREADVSSYDCVLCLECVARCPRDGCLTLEHAGATTAESRFTGGG
jgi:ferredoxin